MDHAEQASENTYLVLLSQNLKVVNRATKINGIVICTPLIRRMAADNLLLSAAILLFILPILKLVNCSIFCKCHISVSLSSFEYKTHISILQ